MGRAVAKPIKNEATVLWLLTIGLRVTPRTCDGVCYPVTHVSPTVTLLNHVETLRDKNMPINWHR